MLRHLSEISMASEINVPAKQRRPIAIVGAGAIVDFAHLPAYRAAGLEVVGIHDRNLERATTIANRHSVPKVYSTLEDLLADDRVSVVDIAVLPDAQPDIATAALNAGKHLLCQKPLALSPATANRLVAHAQKTGLKVAVNQQLRFSESMAVAKAMIDRGWIGEPLAIQIDVDIATDWGAWPWLLTSDRLEVQYHSIHYLDTIRHLVGEPTSVFCRGTRHPSQAPIAETRTTSVLLYPGDLQATVSVNHENISNDVKAEFRIEGSEGVISGTFGLLYNYPHGRPDTLSVWSRSVPTDGWLSYPITTRWLPDAFAGPMASLLDAIDNDTEPLTSASDNLRTVCMIDALYRSMRSSQVESIDLPVAP
jgi:predicted dehydrogenase